MNADIDHRDGGDLTALHHAVLSGFEDVVELLLSRGADVNAPSTTAGLPLCLAVLKDRSHIMRLLLDKFRAAVNLADPVFGTPLHCAAFTGSAEVAELLLQHGAEPGPVNRVEFQKLLPYRDSVSANTLAAQRPFSSDYSWAEITPLMVAVVATNLNLAALLFGTDEVKRPSAVEYDGVKFSSFYPLHAAARWGSSEMVSLNIVHSTDLDLADSYGRTALMGATAYESPERMTQLLRAGASTDLVNSTGKTALIIAGRRGLDHCLKELINARASLDLSDGQKMTAIMHASSHGYESCVRQLAKAGASLNHRDADEKTALMLAGSLGFEKCVRELIEAKASLDLYDATGKTALTWASSNGHDDCVRQLIKAGASIDIRYKGGNTALLKASTRSGNGDCVKQLLEAGASVDHCNEGGFTALIFAGRHGNSDCVDQLLRAGASSAMKTTQHGSTALHEAVLRGHAKCAQLLCDHGADVNARRSTSASPLYCAASNDHLECAQILLKHQADPNLTAEEGWTPLMIAIAVAKPHSAAIVEALLHAGADARARTDEGDTALHMAARWNQNQIYIAQMLLDAGASTAVMNTDNERPLDIADPNSSMYRFLNAFSPGLMSG
jgi:ankyrin repeat protein